MSTTREQILAAARETFSARGYENTRLRDVAALAEVDVALVSYHFRSKDGLFAAAAEMPVPMADLVAGALEGGLDGFAARLLERVVEVWDGHRAALATLIRSAMSHEPAAAALSGFVRGELLERIAGRLDGPDAEARAALFGSQVVGLLMYRYVLGVEPLASMARDEVVARMAPGMQEHLTGHTG